jgi:alkanesulfonate monooxygenase SsuD/methylene tetrahydromethanopterin reductase-like flavin-dependent oxidoreductase (luciferase family)
MAAVRFGVFLSPSRDNSLVVHNAQTAEANGFDFISIQDHPYQPDFLDPFVLMALLAGVTSRLGLVTDVANLPLRPAPMLAKTAATLDFVSGGRFTLGLGGGRSWPQIAGLGGPTWTPSQTVTSIEEALDVMHLLWSPSARASYAGSTYSLDEVAPGPSPAHPIGTWLGAAGPRMLDVLGRKADGWIAPLATPFETKPGAQEQIDDAAHRAGRDPKKIERVLQLVGTVTDAITPVSRPRTGPGRQSIRANPDQWAQIITEFVTAQRFTAINLIPEQEQPERIELFGSAVIPAALARLTT